jgi:hypothetical protein
MLSQEFLHLDIHKPVQVVVVADAGQPTEL